MLEMRPNCEHCDADLAPDARNALICSFECTWCRACAEAEFGGACPNCGGDLQARPRRAAALLQRHPASTRRVHRSGAG